MINLGLRERYKWVLDRFYYRRLEAHAGRWGSQRNYFSHRQNTKTRIAWFIASHDNSITLKQRKEFLDFLAKTSNLEAGERLRADKTILEMIKEGLLLEGSDGVLRLAKESKEIVVLRNIDGIEVKYMLLALLVAAFTWAWLAADFWFIIFSGIGIVVGLGGLVDDYLRSSRF